jgi:hypothetical protein
MQPVESDPVKTFPGTPLVVERQPQQPQNDVVDLVRVNLHSTILADLT